MEYSNLLFASVILPLSALALFFDRSAEYKNFILCVTSALFLLWGRPAVAGLVLLTWIMDYLLALGIEKLPKAKMFFLGADVLWNAAIFIAYTKPWLFEHRLKSAFIIPGIAFYTLKNFSYAADVYAGRIKAERNPFCLMTYSIAYPFLFAGPVVRYGDIEPQIRRRGFDASLMSEGLCSYAAGLAKTVILLPALTELTNKTLYAKELTRWGVWLGIAAFFAAAYVAFTGIADMGVGIARINGFDIKNNYLPISSEKMLGGLVKSCNTSMIEFFDDLRGDNKISAMALTVIFGGAAALFYGGGRYWVVVGCMIGIWLALELAIGYDRIEKLPRILRFIGALAAALLLLSAFAFKTPADRHLWARALFGRDAGSGLGAGVVGYIKNNVWVLAISMIYVTPLRRLIAMAAGKISASSDKNYAAVQRIRTAFLALGLIISYLLMAAAKL